MPHSFSVTIDTARISVIRFGTVLIKRFRYVLFLMTFFAYLVAHYVHFNTNIRPMHPSHRTSTVTFISPQTHVRLLLQLVPRSLRNPSHYKTFLDNYIAVCVYYEACEPSLLSCRWYRQLPSAACRTLTHIILCPVFVPIAFDGDAPAMPRGISADGRFYSVLRGVFLYRFYISYCTKNRGVRAPIQITNAACNPAASGR